MSKLLMITGLGSVSDLVSGKRGAFYNTLQEFHHYWDRIDIIAPKVSGQDPGTKELFGNVYVHISSWPLLLHPIYFLKKGLEIYKKEKFDLMTVQEFPPFYNGIGARLLWQKIRVPYVLELHHIPGYPKTANFKEFLYRWMMKLFIKHDASHAQVVRVVNQKQTSEFLKESGVPENKISYIPSLYIDTEVFRPMNFNKEFDLIFVGRLEKNKGLDLFIDAVKILNAKALIVGSGSLSNKIKYEAQNNKYNIQFHGWAKNQNEVAELINKSKLLVMPSYNEGGPRVVFESLACGTPVLATPVGQVPDFESAITVIDWSPEDIANKAKGLLLNHKQYEKYSLAGIEISKRFEKKEAVKSYADKLKELIL